MFRSPGALMFRSRATFIQYQRVCDTEKAVTDVGDGIYVKGGNQPGA